MFIELARQQMCVARNLAMNGLEARLHQGVHESDKKAFTGCGKHALGGLGGRNAGNAISNSNHCMSPSQNQSIGKRFASDYCNAI
jgi:hypothetical protein